MYYNKPILKESIPKEEEMFLAACEGTVITHHFKEEFSLRDKYYPYVKSFLPKTENILFRYISKYIDRNSSVLNSPYPINQLKFNTEGEDANIVYRCCHVNKEELAKDIKKVPLPEMKGATEKAAFLPLQVLLYFIVRYYMETKQPKKCEIIYYYYGYSVYWKRFNKSFKYGVYNPEIMIYTINNMTYRNIIKKTGSINALILHIVKYRFEYYNAQVANSCDEDIRYVLDQIQSDFGSKINEIARKYHENYENKNSIMSGEAMLDDLGTQRNDTSISASVESFARKYTNKFYMSDINLKMIKSAATLAKEASAKEIRLTLEYISNNVPSEEMHEFYSCMFYIYFNMEDKRISSERIDPMLFQLLMKDVIKKGNSTNKNIMKMRELMDSWLEHGSNRFHVTTRDATRTSYRNAIYYYFIFLVALNN